MKKKLTDVQKKFIKIYLDTLNPTKSAIDAGYCSKNAAAVARLLLDKQYIIDEINSILSSQTRTLNISKAYVVKKLVDIIENSLDDSICENYNSEKLSPSQIKNNAKNIKKQKDVAVALKALENLCKQLDFSENQPKNQDKQEYDDDSSSPKINIINNLDENKL